MKRAFLCLLLTAHCAFAGDLLDLLKEPSLQPDSIAASDHVYRVTILPTFHHPFCVRVVVQPDGTATAFVKRLSGKGGYEYGALDFDERRTCNARDVTVFLRGVASSGFWTMQPTIERQGLDGTTLTLEGIRNGKRHVVQRWSPESGDSFYRLCKQLLAVADASEADAYLPRPKTKELPSTSTPK
jgi:hypothetical protein